MEAAGAGEAGPSLQERPGASRRRARVALPVHSYGGMNEGMSSRQRLATRRVTANLPIALLDRARRVTGKGITETLVEGLELVRRSSAAARARALRGKLTLEVDLETSRERSRR